MAECCIRCVVWDAAAVTYLSAESLESFVLRCCDLYEDTESLNQKLQKIFAEDHFYWGPYKHFIKKEHSHCYILFSKPANSALQMHGPELLICDVLNLLQQEIKNSLLMQRIVC